MFMSGGIVIQATKRNDGIVFRMHESPSTRLVDSTGRVFRYNSEPIDQPDVFGPRIFHQAGVPGDYFLFGALARVGVCLTMPVESE